MSKLVKIVAPIIATIYLGACGGGSGDGSANHLNDSTNNDSSSSGDSSTDSSNSNDSNTSDPSQDTTSGDNDSSNDDNTNTALKVNSKKDAALFLNRASYGPTDKSINDLLTSQTYEKWLNDQFNTPTTYHTPKVRALATKMCADRDNDGNKLLDSWEIKYPRHFVWWDTATNAEDQLRQRVALALSEILVVSDSQGLGLSDFQLAVTSYYDVLVKHAFGNYRDLLEEVTLHPAMGDFLSMSRNQKANAEGTIRPDENYARELLQLFTIGVHELNLDGSVKLDGNNQPIPTYDQKKIEEFAKVFTGWNYAGIGWYEYFAHGDHTKPLVAIEEYHDVSAKRLFNGFVTQTNKTVQQDLDAALDNIFQHANVAPFVSKQLIKRLVTSNPSPQYVARVAEKFNDNGSGVKGDMKAVVSAILLDEEALAATKPSSFGKLREPMLRMTHLWRAFEMQPMLKIGHYWESEKRCGQGTYPSYNFWDSLDYFATRTGQGPLQARSVFNFFKPDYTPSGVLKDNGLTGPEFQIVNENTMVSGSNLFHQLIEIFSEDQPTAPKLDEYSKFNFKHVTDLAANTDELLDYLSLVMLNNDMSSNLRTILSEHLNAADVYKVGREGQFQKAVDAILLLSSSPEYLIQR